MAGMFSAPQMPENPGFKKKKEENENVDLEEIVMAWAWVVFNNTSKKDDEKLARDQIKLHCDWEKVRFWHGEAQFQDGDTKKIPKEQIVFSTTFLNNTEEEHEYSFKAEKRTKSLCETNMSKSFSKGVEFGIHVKLPDDVYDANAGFSRFIEVNNAQVNILEKELSWCADSLIKLPKNTRTEAKLIVTQLELEKSFTMQTKFWGRVKVEFLNAKHGKSTIRVIEGMVEEIFRGREGFHMENNKVVFISHGDCSFRYGIDQRIELTQEPLCENSLAVPKTYRNSKSHHDHSRKALTPSFVMPIPVGSQQNVEIVDNAVVGCYGQPLSDPYQIGFEEFDSIRKEEHLGHSVADFYEQVPSAPYQFGVDTFGNERREYNK